MKKLKILSVLCAMLCCMFMLPGCSLFKGLDATNFVVYYTIGQEFLVGEEFSDANLRGVATLKDGSEKDVTKEMKIDKSDFNKNEVGTYTISCRYGIFEASFNVYVVEEVTHTASINRIVRPKLEKSFKSANGKLEFSANHWEYHNSYVGYVQQIVEFKLENGSLKEYYCVNQTDVYGNITRKLAEMLYVGDETNGFASYNVWDEDSEIYMQSSGTSTLQSFEANFENKANDVYLSKYIDARSLIDFYSASNIENVIAGIDNVSLNNGAYCLEDLSGDIIIVDADGFVCVHGDIEISKTTNIPDSITLM